MDEYELNLKHHRFDGSKIFPLYKKLRCPKYINATTVATFSVRIKNEHGIATAEKLFTGIAICGKKDNFNRKIGTKLALKRLAVIIPRNLKMQFNVEKAKLLNEAVI